MRLVHVLPYYAPAWGFGGVVRAAYGLTVALAKQGHTVIVVTTDAGDGGARLPESEAMEGVQVRRCRNRLPALRRFNLSTPAGMRRMLNEALPGADILHLHEFRTVENLIALPLAREMGIPAVLSPHGTLTHRTGRGAIKRGWDALLGARTARQMRAVAALTADEAAEAAALWSRLHVPPPSTLGVVPNGVNVEEFADLPPRGQFRAQWHIPPDAPLILFLGRLHRRKGAHHLLDALPHLPGVWLAVVGPDEGQMAALRQQAERLAASDRVAFTGLLTGQARLAALADADVLTLPAVGEGLPVVALEAMAAGLPVALSRECHLPEAAESGAGLILESLNGEGIASALAPLLADNARRRRMGEAGRALVAERFTWEAAASAMSRLYAELR